MCRRVRARPTCAVTLALRAEYAERRNTRRAKDAERIDRGHHWSKFSGATIPAHEAYKQPFKDPCNAVFTGLPYSTPIHRQSTRGRTFTPLAASLCQSTTCEPTNLHKKSSACVPNVLSRNSTTVASRPLKSPDNPEKRTSDTTIQMHPGGSNANSSVHCTVDGGSTAVLVGSTNTATSFNEDFNIAGSRHTGDNSRDGKDSALYSCLAVSDMGSQQGKFSCEVCPYVTKYKSHFEQHIRVHTGEKPFKCDICSRAFSQLSTLKEHKHSHMGEKVTCEVCSLELSSNRSLKRHMRRHTGERPFK
ncbi:uncharacterized protein LOC144159582 isoform X2 [Haemaphysalis longicornis]